MNNFEEILILIYNKIDKNILLKCADDIIKTKKLKTSDEFIKKLEELSMHEFKIPLRNINGEIVAYSIIDEDDYEKINSIKWHLYKGYAVSTKYGQMHRLIMNAKQDDPKVDHINNDRLNNKKSNLRFVTDNQNAQNKKKKEGTTSEYIGVCYHKVGKKWVCQIMKKSLFFDKEEHAAYWYDQLAIKNYGLNAKINKIEKPTDFIEPIEQIRNLPKGVSLIGKKYQARITIDSKLVSLGMFETIEEASEAYNKKKQEIKQIKKQEIFLQEIDRNEDNIAIIKTKHGEEFMVDDDKYHDLIQYSWNNDGKGYIMAHIGDKKIYLHRYLINAKEGEIVDHINNNPKDNHLSNLRISNKKLNAHNKTKQDNTSSNYIGVRLTKSNTYQAYIQKDDKWYGLSTHKTEEEAAKARDKKAIELYGTSAKLNFPL